MAGKEIDRRLQRAAIAIAITQYSPMLSMISHCQRLLTEIQYRYGIGKHTLFGKGVAEARSYVTDRECCCCHAAKIPIDGQGNEGDLQGCPNTGGNSFVGEALL
jgi:hypothetical protein